MNLLSFPMIGLSIGLSGLVGAYLPEIIATIAGIKENKLIYGCAMLRWKRGRDFNPVVIYLTGLLIWFFIGGCIGTILNPDPEAFVINVLLSFVIFKNRKNFIIANSIQHPQIIRS